MERDVMDLIKDKEFIELTSAERSEVNELCANEEEFNNMKAMLASIGGLNWSNPTPRPETKERLDHLFQQTYPKAAPVWYNGALAVVVPKDKPIYRQPLIQLAAVGLLFLMIYPIVNNSDDQNKQLAMVEKKEASVKEKSVQNGQKANTKNDLNEMSTTESSVASIKSINSSEAVLSPTESIVSASATSVSAGVAYDFPSTLAGATAATLPGSNHPDGIFREDLAEVFSVPASREPEVFDLLTTSF